MSSAGGANIFGQRKELSRIVFDKHDTDGSGTIDADELRDLCYSFGYFLSDSDLTTALTLLDKDGSGTISYDEFKEWWTTCACAHCAPGASRGCAAPHVNPWIVPPTPAALAADRFAKLQLSEVQQQIIVQISEYFRYFDERKTGKLSHEVRGGRHKRGSPPTAPLARRRSLPRCTSTFKKTAWPRRSSPP